MTSPRGDSHIHLFKDGYRPATSSAPDLELTTYQGLRSEFGIDLALVVGYEGEGRFAGNNDYIAAVAAQTPGLVTVAFQPVSTPPEAGAIESMLAKGHRGLSLYATSAAECESLAAWPGAIWRQLGEAGALISLNTRLVEASSLLPKLVHLPPESVLLSHLGLPGELTDDYWTALERFGELPSVVFKASGFYAFDPTRATRAKALSRAIDILGPRRLVWGSDFSPVLDHEDFSLTLLEAVSNELDPEARALIGHANLHRIITGSTP